MENLEKYKKVFTKVFGIGEDQLSDNLEYNTIPEWDSVAHMSLIAEIEDEFKIEFETDDIVDFSSFGKGKEILKKYDVKL